MVAPVEAGAFGELLQRYRLRAGLSQGELAERAGLSRTGISELERGLKRLPHKDTIARLTDALQLAGAERVTFAAAARGRSGAADARVLTAPPAMPRPAPVALVGREGEMAHLLRFLAGDGPPLLLLAGE